MVWFNPGAALPVAAPPDPGPEFTQWVAGPDSPDRIQSLLNRRPGSRPNHSGGGQRVAISGYFSRQLALEIPHDGGD